MYLIIHEDPLGPQVTDGPLNDKAAAFVSAAAAGDSHKVYGPVVEKTAEQLELLYGLTLELLKVGKINPLFIKLTKIDLLGTETEITALQVINDARAWIDTHVQD